MALKDVKQYYYTMQAQYMEMKEDLADYDEAFKAGHITEEQLEDIKMDIASIEENYNRLRYIMYLFDLPNKKDSKKKFLNSRYAKQMQEKFTELNATAECTEAENNELHKAVISQLDSLTK